MSLLILCHICRWPGSAPCTQQQTQARQHLPTRLGKVDGIDNSLAFITGGLAENSTGTYASVWQSYEQFSRFRL